MSDSQPPQNPYGTPAGTPAGGENPYGAPPPYPSAPAGQPGPPPQSPYDQPPTNPYGQPPAANPYGAAPYGQQPLPQPGAGGPLGDGLDMYGRPLGTDARPGTVTAAGWITLIFSGLSLVLYTFIILALLVAKDEVIKEINKAILDSGSSSSDFNANDAYGLVIGVLLVVALWSLFACVLAVFTMRRSNVARILLVISSVIAGLASLAGVKSIVSAVPLLACVSVIVMLFTGGAGDWFAGRRRY